MATKSKKSTKVSKTSTVSNGTLLREFRKQNKLSQAIVAKVVGKNFRTISKWENGHTEIPSDLITLLNKKYKLGLTTVKNSKVNNTTKVKVTTKSKATTIKTKGQSNFIKNFRTFLESTGLSISAFAKRYEMSPKSVSRIISGTNLKSYLSVSTLIKLSKDTDITKLFK